MLLPINNYNRKLYILVFINKFMENKELNMEKPEFELPKEAIAKIEAIKSKLENLKKNILKEVKDIIAGIALLPPNEKEKEKINVLCLIDVSEKKNWYELREDAIKKTKAIAEKIDKNIVIEIMDIFEVREACFDGKYEVLKEIGMSAPIYDPNELLAALKIAEVHKTMAIKKFEKYIVSYVAVGSLFRGDARSNDIDVAIIVDDTDVKKMSRTELRDKLGAIIREMGYHASKITGVKKVFHIQTYILTDFWESVKDAQPVIFTFLRDGVPLYDRGVFMPWKLLLKMGRIRPSPEAIEMQMDIGEKLIQRTKGKMLSIVGEDLYYAVLNPAQAALMLYGIAPPTPKETIKLLDDIFVKKEKLLEKKYVDLLERIRNYYKDIEHGKIKDVKGVDIDNFLNDTEDYLKRIKKLFEQIEKRRSKETLDEAYDGCINLIKDVLESNNVVIKGDIINLFKKEMVDKKKMPVKALEILKLVAKTKEDYSKNKLSPQELEKVKKEARVLIKLLIDYVQRKRGYEVERAKIRFKYGEKFGEVILLEDVAYIITDIDAKDKEIQKASIKSNGALGNVEKSNFEEYEEKISKLKAPQKVFIKEKIFESLRKLFGSDIEILLNY